MNLEVSIFRISHQKHEHAYITFKCKKMPCIGRICKLLFYSKVRFYFHACRKKDLKGPTKIDGKTYCDGLTKDM